MHHRKVLITGSRGLIGSAVSALLRAAGVEVRQFDLRASGENYGDVCDFDSVRSGVAGCDGVIHLAAVSRVVWGEQRPQLCWRTNEGGLRNVLAAAAESARSPWVLFGSSREIYGRSERFPVDESCPANPINVYGRSKVAGERLVEEACLAGVRAGTARFSNVFGSIDDHADRVVPAFACGAACGRTIRVDGAEHSFDFTHVDDVAAGILALTALLAEAGSPPPPVHFVSGVETTLRQLARMAIRLAGSTSKIRYAPPRNFDVERFVGSGERARRWLGWMPRTSLESGLGVLVDEFRDDVARTSMRGAAL